MANECFAQARTARKGNDLSLAYGLCRQGLFHNQVTHDGKRAEAALTQALAIRRRALDSNDPRLAGTMIAFAYAKELGRKQAERGS